MRKYILVSRFRLVAQVMVGMILLTIVAIEAGSGLARADGGVSSFGLQPVYYDPSDPLTRSYFIFDSRPGMALHSQFRITNSGTVTGVAMLYAVDATTSQTSGAVYLSRTASQRDVGTWIALGIHQVTLAPGQSQIIPFQVSIPVTVRPGQHVGGIVAENLQPGHSSQGNSIHINVQNLTIIAVQLNLPGPQIEQLIATGITPGGTNNYQTLQISLRNSGTVMLKPSGSLHVSDEQGHLLQAIPLTLDTFLPETAIEYPAYIRGQALDAGIYRATLDLRYGHGHHLHYTATFTVTQQQLTQVYKPLAPPLLPGSFSALPSWLTLLLGLLLVSNISYWGWKLYRFVAIPLLRRKRKVTT